MKFYEIIWLVECLLKMNQPFDYPGDIRDSVDIFQLSSNIFISVQKATQQGAQSLF